MKLNRNGEKESFIFGWAKTRKKTQRQGLLERVK